MGKKIVIIDDDKVILQLAQKALETVGFEVVLLETPLGATIKILSAKPDLILIDVNMPELSGEHLVSVLREVLHDNDVPIVFYSSLEESKLTKLVERYGASGYIQKGDGVERFVNEVKSFLGDRRPGASG